MPKLRARKTDQGAWNSICPGPACRLDLIAQLAVTVVETTLRRNNSSACGGFAGAAYACLLSTPERHRRVAPNLAAFLAAAVLYDGVVCCGSDCTSA